MNEHRQGSILNKENMELIMQPRGGGFQNVKARFNILRKQQRETAIKSDAELNVLLQLLRQMQKYIFKYKRKIPVVTVNNNSTSKLHNFLAH